MVAVLIHQLLIACFGAFILVGLDRLTPCFVLRGVEVADFVIPLAGAGAVVTLGHLGEHAQLTVVAAPTHAAWAALATLGVFLALILVGGLLVHGADTGLALGFCVELSILPFLPLGPQPGALDSFTA